MPFAKQLAYLKAPLVDDLFPALRNDGGQMRDGAIALCPEFRDRFRRRVSNAGRRRCYAVSGTR